MRSYRMVCAALMVAAAAVSQAASPELVGNYSGSFKAKIRTASGQTSVKSAMLLSIAADDVTTVTIDGVVQLSPSAGNFGPSTGLVVFADPVLGINANGTFASGSFKNSVFKGTAQVVTLDVGPPQVVISTGTGKFKLKKLP